MVAPCDKFQGLVVGPDGQTVQDPWGMLPTLGDYEDWRGVARGLIDRAEAELSAYFEAHGAVPEDLAGPVLGLGERWEALGGAVKQAFQNFGAVTWSDSIQRMVTLARDAACQIGIVEAARIELGGTEADIPTPPPSRPKPTGKGGGKGKGILVALALIAAGFYFGDRK